MFLHFALLQRQFNVQFWLAALHEHEPWLVLCAHAPLHEQRTSAVLKDAQYSEDENVHFIRQITAEANIPPVNLTVNESFACGFITYLGGFRVFTFFWIDQRPVKISLMGFIVGNGFINFHI